MIKQCNGCEHPIEVDTEWSGLSNRTLFRDGDTERKCDDEIDECPGCGESVTSWLKTGKAGGLVMDTSKLTEVKEDTHLNFVSGGISPPKLHMEPSGLMPPMRGFKEWHRRKDVL
ncbi:MAG: hypothetical protein GY928_34235 [Colwellia sp.]|nr:hypothetical protein [Colwellia sp.]